jgi:hypothetical protein
MASIGHMEYQMPPGTFYNVDTLGFLDGKEWANVTPPEMRCTLGACPAVYASGDDLLVIGTTASTAILEKMLNDGYTLPTEGEYAIVVEKKLLACALDMPSESE